MLTAFPVFQEIVQSRRSVRRWLDEPIPHDDLERMVDCARLAPSDTNAQPWHFTVVTDRTVIRRLERAVRQRLADLEADLARSGRPEVARKLKVFAHYAAHFGSAPALVLVSGEPYDSRFMRELFAQVLPASALAQMARDESLKSTALAAMNLLLAVHALGYGAVPMTGPVLMIPELLKAELGVPPRFEPHLLIAVGRPDLPPLAAVPRKSLAAVTSWIE